MVGDAGSVSRGQTIVDLAAVRIRDDRLPFAVHGDGRRPAIREIVLLVPADLVVLDDADVVPDAVVVLRLMHLEDLPGVVDGDPRVDTFVILRVNAPLDRAVDVDRAEIVERAVVLHGAVPRQTMRPREPDRPLPPLVLILV